jgi:hypothetical protein
MRRLHYVCLFAFASFLPAQTASVALRLNDDVTSSGYGGRAPRLIEAGTIAGVSVQAPPGSFAFIFAGNRLEPGIPFPGSPFPISIANVFDVTLLFTGMPAPAAVLPGHLPGAPGRLEGGLSIFAALRGLRIGLQAFVAVPGPPLTYLLTNPIELEVPAAAVGPAVSVEPVLSAPVVSEADNGGVLTVAALARDAAGRTLAPSPPFQVTTNAPGATFPAPDRIAFPRHGSFTVTVTLTGTSISGRASVRVVPEVEPDQFPLYVMHMTGLERIADSGLRALALGDRSGVNAAVTALSAGIQAGAIPAVTGRALRMPLLANYPTVQQLVANGNFPTNPDDPQLLPRLNAITQSLQGLQALLTAAPGPLPPAQIALLASRTSELETLIQGLLARDFSAREIYAQLPVAEPLLNQLAPAVMRRAAEFVIESLRQAPDGIVSPSTTAVYTRFLFRLIRGLYGPYLDYLGRTLAQLELFNLIDYLLRPYQTLNLCDICSQTCLVGCTGVTFNCGFDFHGTGLSAPPSRYRILVLRIPSRISEVVNALNAHDTTADYFRVLERLGLDGALQFFTFTPTGSGTGSPWNCGLEPYLELNAWPLARQGLPAPLIILVLRMDALSGLSNALQKVQY